MIKQTLSFFNRFERLNKSFIAISLSVLSIAVGVFSVHYSAKYNFMRNYDPNRGLEHFHHVNISFATNQSNEAITLSTSNITVLDFEGKVLRVINADNDSVEVVHSASPNKLYLLAKKNSPFLNDKLNQANLIVEFEGGTFHFHFKIVESSSEGDFNVLATVKGNRSK